LTTDLSLFDIFIDCPFYEREQEEIVNSLRRAIVDYELLHVMVQKIEYCSLSLSIHTKLCRFCIII